MNVRTTKEVAAFAHVYIGPFVLFAHVPPPGSCALVWARDPQAVDCGAAEEARGGVLPRAAGPPATHAQHPPAGVA